MNKIIRLIALMLTAAVLFCVVGCGDDSTTSSKKPSKDKTSSVSSDDSSSEDLTSSDDMSSDENENDFSSESDDKSDVSSEDTSMEPENVPQNSKRQGITYYVSANGTSKDGTNINAPMSLETANQKQYADGDKILFKRGDIFYGSINFNISVASTAEADRAYVGAYGIGANPIITAEKVISDPNSFVKQGGFWVADLTDSSKYTGFVTDENVNNVGFFIDKNKNVFPSLKPTMDTCANEYDFHCKDGKIYIKASKNPISALGTLSFATEKHLVRMRSNTEYCNLTLRMTSGHGMNKGEDECRNIYVHDMVIEYIGGALQYSSNTDTHMVRYGNGIEFYNGPVDNVLIEECIIRKCYDVAFTMQGVSHGYNNVTVRNCVMYHNKQSIEIFNEGQSTGVTGLDYSYNICINSGNGAWGYEAFNAKTGVPCEFLFYNYFPEAIDIKYHHNIVFNPIRLYWWAGTTSNMKQFIEGVQTYKNTLYLGNIPLYNSSLRGQMGVLREQYDKEILSKTYNLANADMSKYDGMINAAETSYDIDDIRKATEKCGVKFQ